MVVGASQSFQFFREISWFLGSKRALSKFKYWILHHLISIIKLQFYVNHASHHKMNTEIKARKPSNFETRRSVSKTLNYKPFIVFISSVTMYCFNL